VATQPLPAGRSRPKKKHDRVWQAACAILAGGLLLTGTQLYAMDRERQQLVDALGAERTASVKERLARVDVEQKFANYILETRVRRDFVTDRMVAQERESHELKQEAQAVQRQKLAEADCITPRSIITAAGL